MARGGVRPGAGRKTLQATVLRRTIQENGAEDAAYAYSLFVTAMRDGHIALARLTAAKEVMDRVLGKPKQILAGAPDEPLRIEYMTVNYRDAYPETPDVETRSTGDSEASSQVQVAGDGQAMG